MIAASFRFLSRLFPFLPAAGLLLASAATAGCGTSPEPSPDPTSDTVTVPERAVEVFEAGAGDSTVVFESGLGNDWTSWKQVASDVAAEARVFAYSRPGYGQSEPSPEPRDAAHIVEDLRGLLAARGYSPPYLLVGHSFGGAYMELFAKAHPEEVTGVVLVDTRHRDFTTACEKGGFKGCSIPASILEKLPQVQQDEFKAFADTSVEMQAVGGFGPYPVRVLTATAHGFSPELEGLWESMHKSLAGEAADGEQSLFVGVGHNIQVQRPHEVAQVILSLLPAPKD